MGRRRAAVPDYPENPLICINARFLDRILAADDSLILSVDGTAAGLTIPQGEAAAIELARKLVPYTRSAPIADNETYEYTKTVLHTCSSGRRYTGDFIVVGSGPIGRPT